MKTGFATATGDVILYTDADLPLDMADLPRAVRLLREYDVDIVSAYRFTRTSEGYLRSTYTFGVYNLLIRTLFDVKARDINFASLLSSEPAFRIYSCSFLPYSVLWTVLLPAMVFSLYLYFLRPLKKSH